MRRRRRPGGRTQLPGRRMIAGEQAALKAVILMNAGRDDDDADGVVPPCAAACRWRRAMQMAVLGASLQSASRGND